MPKGPRLGALTAAVVDWQLAHPGGSKEDALAHVRELLAAEQARG